MPGEVVVQIGNQGVELFEYYRKSHLGQLFVTCQLTSSKEGYPLAVLVPANEDGNTVPGR